MNLRYRRVHILSLSHRSPRRGDRFHGGGGNNVIKKKNIFSVTNVFNVFPLRVSFSVFLYWNFICIGSDECPLQMYLMSVRLDFFLSIFTPEFPFVLDHFPRRNGNQLISHFSRTTTEICRQCVTYGTSMLNNRCQPNICN